MGNRARTPRNADSSRLIGAVALSVSLHLLVAAAWIVHPPRLNHADNPNKAEPIVRFGIDQSQHRTIAWLGFIEPTPNEAALSTIDQSALSPSVTPPSPATSPPSASTATPASRAVLVRAMQAQAAAQSSLSRLLLRGQFAVVQLLETAADAAESAEAAAADAAETEPQQPERPPPAQDETQPTDPTPSTEPTPPAIESPKEADAASRDKPLEYRHGKVASREGLDITTVKPRWTGATLLTANPRNPLVRIEFGSDGKVKRAAYEGVGSGSEAVDQTLLNAIYAWTAKGAEIEDLKKTDPKGVVTARIRIRLR